MKSLLTANTNDLVITRLVSFVSQFLIEELQNFVAEGVLMCNSRFKFSAIFGRLNLEFLILPRAI